MSKASRLSEPLVPHAVAHVGLALVETDEAAALDLLLADRQLGPLLRRRLGPTLALFPAGKVDAVVKHLRRLGHLPHIAPTEGAP